ncbi:MAG: hypothetical protein KIH69_018555, partial [Anaerolineae bacterium]|nr:hypothetical protein [Anaerolineae bacterium]
MLKNKLKLVALFFSLVFASGSMACNRLPNVNQLLNNSQSQEATPIPLVRATSSGTGATITSTVSASSSPATTTAAPAQPTSAAAATATPAHTPTSTPRPIPSPTPTRIAPTPQSTPDTMIMVNTFEPEVFPFKKNGNCSLGEAIWAAQTQTAQDGCKAGGADGTTIILTAGVYTFAQADTKSSIILPGDINLPQPASALAALPVIGGDITIVGKSSTLQRVGAQPFRFFDIHPTGRLILQDLTLSGGDPGKLDGGAIQNLGQLQLISVTLQGNAAYDGGAIANLNEVELIASSLISNSARHYGGAIYGEGGLFVIQDSRLVSNTAKEVGGAAYGVRTKFEVSRSQFDSNTATLGGAIYNEDSRLVLGDGSVVRNNRATQDMGKAAFAYGGGGIVSFGVESVVTIEDSQIIGNRASKSSGGALTNWSGAVSMTRTVISGNVATVAGAVLDGYFGGVTVIADGCILNNESLRPESAHVVAFTKVSLDASNNWWGSEDGPMLPPTPTPVNTPTPRPPTRTPLPTATPKIAVTAALTATAPS